MSRIMFAAAVGLALALGACSKTERQDTAADVKAAADRVGQKAKDAANSPEIKKAGAELKDAAGDAADATKSVLKGAAAGARDGLAKAEAEGKKAADARDAKDAKR
ncbi:cell surface protein [Phenylobacterium sp.]|uniref:cell surface protein n=1 Tax=Phenylobacterium sp. TaxID=1871053 RepID=UPI0025EEC5B6|nr:cell surface protein [Phenylobacterium sp.]MBX3482108.1 cell surface protein [Phenylobacterium sp.]MCW5758607.1 cell surface protein [Phenylobacterium sp.]